MSFLNRRRFLTMSAACLATPVWADLATFATWRGTALGAPASLRIEGMDQVQAAPLFDRVEAELLRLERIFSLYRLDSQIVQLNQTGILRNPAPELLQVLSLSAALNRATNGAFDPTIQPLWQARALGGTDALAADHAVGWDHLQFDTSRVQFDRPGMAITLNGIAQGAVTDHIAQLLRDMGLRNVLVDLGEIAAMGGHASGADWQVGVADPQGQIVQRLTLRDRALATSAPMAPITTLAPKGAHVFHPLGQMAVNQLVCVSAPNAMLADGLSTALCMIDVAELEPVLLQFPQSQIEKIV